MEINVTLVDKISLKSICSWHDSEMLNYVPHADNLDNIFDVSIKIGDIEFSAFSPSLYDVVLDFIINHRMVINRIEYSYFVADRPLFFLESDDSGIAASYFDKKSGKTVIPIRIEEIDEKLSVNICHGLSLLRKISPKLADGIFQHVYDDMASENRKDFIPN